YGAGSSPEEHIELLLPLKKISIAYDNDPAGVNGCGKVIAALNKNNYLGQIFVVKWGDGKPGFDVTDWFNECTGQNKVELFYQLFQAYTFNDLNVREEISLQSTDGVSKRPWPTLLKDAFYGVFGEFVNAIAHCTEADPGGILVQMLSCFSNIVGAVPFYMVGATVHRLNIFTVIAGRTSKARKGTGWDICLWTMKLIDFTWWANNVKSGLSSGEGLAWEVRDPLPDSEDQGVLDKRLEVFEPEFSKVLKVNARTLNTLSEVIRQAWDSGKVSIMNKNSRVKATDAFISINGHITIRELRLLLSETDVFNGFGNRFLWFCVKRSNILPFGDDFEKFNVTPYIKRIKDAVAFSKTTGRIQFNDDAKKAWSQIYRELSEERAEDVSGLFDELTARAEAQVIRLACIYALSDMSSVVRVEHLKAALALWKYCEDSVRYIFSDALANPMAEKILNALKCSPKGMNRTEIAGIFQNNKKKSEIDNALALLLKINKVRKEMINDTGGRSEERWLYIGQ
ncbi:MAG: DUF3987 domain-containing protein, partial [Candidatus Margulisiibacteriota bacterium]